MGYIKKLKNNELVGGTDKHTVYPVTSTEAVFEEIINGNESSFKSQKFLNNNITGDRINEGTITDYNIAVGTVTKGKLTPQVQTMLDEGQKKALTPKGDYDAETVYEALDLVFDTATNSSYVSLITPNTEPLTNEDAWEMFLDGTAVNTAQAAINAKVDELDTQVDQAIEDARQELQDATDSANGAAELAMDVVANKVADAQIGYFECNTVAGTALKQTTFDYIGTGDDKSYYTIPAAGSNVRIKMQYANTASGTVELQFGSNTATKKQLKYNGLAASNSNSWDAGEVISVYYDGTYYQASNAQGGGGKAEKIKYDNSASGLAAENVQGALDETYEYIDNIHSNEFSKGVISANCHWCSLGTSITWYNNNVISSFTKGYQTRVMEKIKFSSFTNKGINGGTMATGGGYTGLGDSLSNIVSADIYTIEYGINDFIHSLPVGVFSDYQNNTGTGTFYGAFRKVIDYIRSINIDAKIILCTPRKAYGFNNYLPAHWYDQKNGIYLKDYVEAIDTIAEYESLVLCDWFRESEANQANLANLSIDVALHPNDKGYELMANVLVSSMRKLFNTSETDFIYIGQHQTYTQTVLPTLSSGGSTFNNKSSTTIGPSIPATRNSRLTKILSSVSKNGYMMVRIIDPSIPSVVGTYRDILLNGTQVDVSALDIRVPIGCYVTFGNKETTGTVNSIFSFSTTSGGVCTEAYGDSSNQISLDQYPRLAMTLGFELTSL